MDLSSEKSKIESHPLLPSGSWEGFYTYATNGGGAPHEILCEFIFKNETIVGSGQDDIGAFQWRGDYNLGSMTCSLKKFYNSHTVVYTGHIDDNGIWGTWNLNGMTGGFHLWPAKMEQKNKVALKNVKVVTVDLPTF